MTIEHWIGLLVLAATECGAYVSIAPTNVPTTLMVSFNLPVRGRAPVSRQAQVSTSPKECLEDGDENAIARIIHDLRHMAKLSGC